MINVSGDKIVLAGPNEMLAKELAYLIGTLQSRMASQGHKSGYIDAVISGAMHNAVTCTLEDLRSESKMAAAWTGRPS